MAGPAAALPPVPAPDTDDYRTAMGRVLAHLSASLHAWQAASVGVTADQVPGLSEAEQQRIVASQVASWEALRAGLSAGAVDLDALHPLPALAADHLQASAAVHEMAAVTDETLAAIAAQDRPRMQAAMARLRDANTTLTTALNHLVPHLAPPPPPPPAASPIMQLADLATRISAPPAPPVTRPAAWGTGPVAMPVTPPPPPPPVSGWGASASPATTGWSAPGHPSPVRTHREPRWRRRGWRAHVITVSSIASAMSFVSIATFAGTAPVNHALDHWHQLAGGTDACTVHDASQNDSLTVIGPSSAYVCARAAAGPDNLSAASGIDSAADAAICTPTIDGNQAVVTDGGGHVEGHKLCSGITAGTLLAPGLGDTITRNDGSTAQLVAYAVNLLPQSTGGDPVTADESVTGVEIRDCASPSSPETPSDASVGIDVTLTNLRDATVPGKPLVPTGALAVGHCEVGWWFFALGVSGGPPKEVYVEGGHTITWVLPALALAPMGGGNAAHLSQTPPPPPTPTPVPVPVPVAPSYPQRAQNGAPPGATAQCVDGTYSYAATTRGQCSHHGGIATVLP